MAYDKQTWANGSTGGTPLSAERLNHVEDGLKSAWDALAALREGAPEERNTFAEVDAAITSLGEAVEGLASGALSLEDVQSTVEVAISSLTKTSVGLDQVDNTTDAAKPISTATQTALTSLTSALGTLTTAVGAKADLAGGKVPIAQVPDITSSKVSDFTEATQDAIAAMLASGANVTLSYNDAGNSLQITASGTDAEVVRDTIGAALVGVNGVTVTVNDAADTITLGITGLSISQITGLQAALDSPSRFTFASVTGDAAAVASQHVRADASVSSRTVLDGVVTTASATVTSATVAFTSADVGKPLYGLGIPAGATVASVQSATSITMSVNATTTLTAVNLTIGAPDGITITLPASAPAGTQVKVEKVDSTTRPVSIVPSSGDTLTGATVIRSAGYVRTYTKNSITGWIAVDGLTPVLHGIPSSGGGARVTTPRGNRVSATGDSIAPPTVDNTANLRPVGWSGTPGNWLFWAMLYSDAQIQIVKCAGIGSTTGDQITARMHADVLTQPTDFVVCDASFTNSSSLAQSAASFIVNLKKQIAAVQAMGATPILHTGWPVPTAYRAVTDKWRRAVMWLANTSPGVLLFDSWSVMADPATGGYLSQYDSGDGVHPNNLGKKVIGQAFATFLTPFLSGAKAIPQWDNGTQSGSLLPNGLFLNATSGVPTGWSKSGSVATTVNSDDTTIRGNYLRFLDTASGGYTQVAWNNIPGTTTGLGGHLIEFTGRVKATGVGTGTLTLSATLGTAGAGQAVALNALQSFGAGVTTDGWRTFQIRAVAPADCNGININANTSGGTGLDISLAQLRIDDLTANGYS